jgi:hypothetical protein
MNDRKKRTFLLSSSPNTFLYFALVILVFISTFRFFFSEGFRPKLVSSLKPSAIEAVSVLSVSGEISPSPTVLIRETVVFPEEVLVFLKYPKSTTLFTKDAIDCVYSSLHVKLAPVSIDHDNHGNQIVRCQILSRGVIPSVALKSAALGPTATYFHDTLAYEALIDKDNTTVVFAKGLRLQSGRISNASRIHCVYGQDLIAKKPLFTSNALSAAQEIVRCKTPLSILTSQQRIISSMKVSVRITGRRTLPSIARLQYRVKPDPVPNKQYKMCICTMLRNQARFLPEWVTYHSRIGVEKWFIYDNNSNDDIEDVIDSLVGLNFNITRRIWPWIKTQEAGFAHCAIQSRDLCKWVGFIDVDEFFHLRPGLSLHDIIGNYSTRNDVAELRTICYSFGPSGLDQVPPEGNTIGYTCRMRASERHKSILKPEGINSTLINMVHHFHLKDGFGHVNLDRNVMVINHYKYQVWDVFKEKFHMRVATYVTDWENDKNVGSKDRAPGLGTIAVEPVDWSKRFCEVMDRGLKKWIMANFVDPKTGLLPWQSES